MTCLSCYKILFRDSFKAQFTLAIRSAYNGDITKALALDSIDEKEENLTLDEVETINPDAQTRHTGSVLNTLIRNFFRKTKPNVCPYCKATVGSIKVVKGFRFHHFDKSIENDSDDEDSNEKTFLAEDSELLKVRKNTIYTNEEIRMILKRMYKQETSLLAAVYNVSLEKMTFQKFAGTLFIDKLLVTPSKFRPVASRNDKKYEGQQTTLYSQIIETCVELQKQTLALTDLSPEKSRKLDSGTETTQAQEQDRIKKQLTHLTGQLQLRVSVIFNGAVDRTSSMTPVGVKQLIEKKKGLFRMNIMGKRVNYSARTVVGPDPYISTVEIGIPMMFAKTLTYPVGVTSFNIKQLSRLVLNGPDNYPGATGVVLNFSVTWRFFCSAKFMNEKNFADKK